MRKKLFFWLVFILMTIFLIILSYFSVRNIIKNKIASKCMDDVYKFSKDNEETVFSINKIVYYSSSNANADINPNSSFTISNLYQYTDIAIFINSNSDGNFTAKNTLKNVTLSDIKFNLTPSIGTPNLYYKNINDFATNKYDENNLVSDTLDFSISSEDEIDYSAPTLFNNSANPITLCYVNSDLKPNYTLPAGTSNISYDGKLLKDCNVTLNSIACKISFLITIVNNLDETFTCPVILNIPLSTENETIYDGKLLLNDATDYNFIKIN